MRKGVGKGEWRVESVYLSVVLTPAFLRPHHISNMLHVTNISPLRPVRKKKTTEKKVVSRSDLFSYFEVEKNKIRNRKGDDHGLREHKRDGTGWTEVDYAQNKTKKTSSAHQISIAAYV